MKVKLKLLVFKFIVIFALSAAHSVYAIGVVGSINVGKYPEGVAYDSGKGEIFVINWDSSSVSVISDSTNTVITNVTVSGPTGIAYDSGKGEIFVTNGGSWSAYGNTVSVISDSTNTIVATINVGNDPTGLAYDSGKGEIFVSNSGTNTLSVISDSTNDVVATVPMGSAPGGIALRFWQG